jgi:adenylate cyclase
MGRLLSSLRRQSVVLVAVVMVVMLSLTIFRLMEAAELSATNVAFRIRGPEKPASPVAIVAIDDTTFDINGLQWPWPRTYFAQIVDRLKAGGAKLIAFDVFFFEPEALGQPASYTVQGDTVSSIAAQFNVPSGDIITANNLDPTGKLCAGQTLTIPTQPPQTYVVKKDRAEDLAARYKVDLDILLEQNGLKDACDLRPSDLLLIPVAKHVDYTAAAGDTVASVAAQFQISPLAVTAPDGAPAQDPLNAGQGLIINFGDKAFAASIRAAGNVILNGQKSTIVQAGFSSETLGQPLPVLRDAMAGFGISNVAPDVDGAVHAILAWDTASDQLYYSWPIVVQALYTGVPLDPNPTRSAVTLGSQTIPLDGRFIRVNYAGPEGSIPTYSALQVVNGDLPLDTFKDKVIFIGATTESLHDTYPTPFDFTNPTPGVEIMANVFNTLYTRQFVARLPVAVSLLSILVAGLLALALTLIRRPGAAIGALLGLMAAYAVVWLLVFLFARVEGPLMIPEITLFVGFVTPSLERAVSEELEKRRVRGIFELFISPEMVGQLIDQGIEAMRGKRSELTILFSDIRGFTTMSEKMTPEELVDLLNEYLGAMTDVIHKNGGTVDKYEGDLIMAFFGAPVAYPDHTQRAVQTSIEMRQELDRLRQKWAAEGKPSKLEMGIGLNTGEVFVGLVGSGKRVNYTVMGDAVNLASRLQDLTKELQWPLLISEFTYEKIKNDFDAEFAEARLVKGKTVPVGIYKVLGRTGAGEDQRVRALYK